MQESTNRAKVSKKEDNGKSGTLKPDFGWGEKHKKFLVSCESVSSRFVQRQNFNVSTRRNRTDWL